MHELGHRPGHWPTERSSMIRFHRLAALALNLALLTGSLPASAASADPLPETNDAVSGAAVMLRDITVVGGGVSADARGGDSPCSLVLENVSIVGVPKCAIMAFGGGTVAMNGGGIETPPEVFDALVWVAGKGSKASLTGCALKVHGGKSSLATMDDGELAVSSCSLNGPKAVDLARV